MKWHVPSPILIHKGSKILEGAHMNDFDIDTVFGGASKVEGRTVAILLAHVVSPRATGTKL
eukprot:10770825-Ditylum_brightwellii.AAC.1